ncbi:MAG: ribulokinase [Bacteroidota bacterium]|nr:ribulokinase [Bacteroidota bacterium]
MKDNAFVIGVDFGTDSVRTIIVNAASGEEMAASLFYYPRWKRGQYCNPSINQFRQHPKDYLEGLEYTVRDCISKVGPDTTARIRAIGVDTTGSSPVAVDKSGTPLSLLPGFAENPNAMFVLWKDHTSVKEAAEINRHAKNFTTDYLQFVGGIYSSEWFWSKCLHVFREDDAVRKACYTWVEHCDWIPFLLTGGTDTQQMKRGVCSAGHKALWSETFGGFPPDEFFTSLDPLLQGQAGRLPVHTFTSDQPAGTLSGYWANQLGLSENVVVAVGAFDAHMGAVGGQIEPYYLSKVMGTSTCDMLVAPAADMQGKLVKGICGQVNGSVIPGMIGMEAGQSAFGDAYAWFKNLVAWPLLLTSAKAKETNNRDLAALIEETHLGILPELNRQAAQLPVTEESEIAIDWFNGRRTPDANQELKGTISQLNLASGAPEIFRAVAESTCFGARAIVERFISQGIPVKGLIGLGGVARKSPYIMQMMADIIRMPIRIHRSEQTCALGAAMFAATAVGIYPQVEDAMKAMGPGFDTTYTPDQSRASVYEKRYTAYLKLGNSIENLSIQSA